MSTITKEQLRERARQKVKSLELAVTQTAFADSRAELEEELELARIALASLEAEPVSVFKIDHESSLIKHVKKVVSETNAPPAPVVPDDVMAAIQKVARIRLDMNDFDGDKRGILDCLSEAEEALIEVVNRRAAMLQGAVQPQNQQQNIPENIPVNTPCKEAPEHIWLQTAGVWPENGEFSELTWCSDNQHDDDTLYVRADVVTGNYPVIPDGWVACSERMPDIGTEIFYFCQDDGLRDCGIVSSSNFSGRGDAQLYVHTEGYDLRFGVDITHWMPLPVAPKLEVK